MIRHSGKKKKKTSASVLMFCGFVTENTQSEPSLPPESAVDKGISVCSSQREVRQLSRPARRKRSLRGTSGSRRDWSASSRAPLRKTHS